MLNQILMAFICIFAVVGVLTVIYGIIEFFLPCDTTDKDIEMVMFIKNRENEIESVVRNVVCKINTSEYNIKPKSINLVDVYSDDLTPEILSTLEKDFEICKFYTIDEYIKKLNTKYMH